MYEVQCLVPSWTFLLNGNYWDKLIFFFYFFVRMHYLILEVELKGRKDLIVLYYFKNQNMQRNLLFPLGFFPLSLICSEHLLEPTYFVSTWPSQSSLKTFTMMKRELQLTFLAEIFDMHELIYNSLII